MKKSTLAKMIDHTLLLPTAGVLDITKLCSQAKMYNFASVCVNPCYVALAKNELCSSDVQVCTVIGFPLGASSTETKIFESLDAIKNGADEIDMVMNIGDAIDARFNNLSIDIQKVVNACKNVGYENNKNILVKVILETCFLDYETINTCCMCAKRAGADFVKTSTGFATPKSADGKLLPNGAAVQHIKLMRETVGDKMGVKASGGIRSARQVASMISAGANRIGTSSSIQIYESWDEAEKIIGYDGKEIE